MGGESCSPRVEELGELEGEGDVPVMMVDDGGGSGGAPADGGGGAACYGSFGRVSECTACRCGMWSRH
jgi:hypothetical protein